MDEETYSIGDSSGDEAGGELSRGHSHFSVASQHDFDSTYGSHASRAQRSVYASFKTQNIDAFSTRYAWSLYKWRKVWLGFWFVVLALSGWQGPQLLFNTTEAFKAAPSTRAATVNQLAGMAIPSIADTNQLVVLVRSTVNDTVLTPGVEAFSLAINQTVRGLEDPSYVQSVQSYFVSKAADMPATVYDQFVSKDKTATFLALFYHGGVSDNKAADLSDYLRTQIKTLQADMGAEGQRVDITLIGIAAFLKPMNQALERGMVTMDAGIMPIALVVLWTMLRTWRLMLIPGPTIAVSVLGSFAVVQVCVTPFIGVFTVAPTLMMSLVLALSIDYSLFMLVRYRTELTRTQDHFVSVVLMLRYAGHTIAVSSMTLTVVFFGMLMFGVPSIFTLGIGAGAAVVVTVIVNETLLPVILLSFPNFFSKSSNTKCFDSMRAWVGRHLCCCFSGRGEGGRRRSSDDDSLLGDEPGTRYGSHTPSWTSPQKPGKVPAEPPSPVPGSPSAAPLGFGLEREASIRKAARDAQQRMEVSLWYRLGKTSTRWPWNLLLMLLVLGATVPFGMYAFNWTIVNDVEINIPRGTPSALGLAAFITEFGFGSVLPFRIVITPPMPLVGSDVPPILQDQFVTDMQDWLSNVGAKLPGASLTDYNSIMMAQGIPVPASLLQLCLLGKTPIPPVFTKTCNGIRFANGMLSNDFGTSTSIMFSEKWSPGGAQSSAWIDAAWDAADALAAKNNYTIQVIGFGQDAIDTVALVSKKFPTMLFVTCGATMLLVGLAFKSILVPLRSIFTIAVTLMYAYGAANLVFEHGILNWLGVPGLHQQQSIMYLAPLVAFSIIVGTSLDYDVFILMHIYEMYDNGFKPREAVARGLYGTGFIITAAGVIMALAFLGLVLAEEPSVNEMGFYMVFAVLFDTFVVRSLMVPAIMGMLGEASWFPANTQWCKRHCPSCVRQQDSIARRAAQKAGLRPERSWSAVDPALKPRRRTSSRDSSRPGGRTSISASATMLGRADTGMDLHDSGVMSP